MPLVNVPDRLHSFRKWVREVEAAAEMRFGSRAKAAVAPSTRRRRRKRRKKTRPSRTRRSKNG